MDGISVLHFLDDGPPLTSQPAYQAGNALGWLYRGNKQAATNHPLAGRLYLSKSNWLLLSVPNSLVRGVFDALTAPGAELPTAGVMNVPNVAEDILNAHISVMTADEVEKIGPDNINERGHMFGYSLGALKEITPKNVAGVSKIWAIQISSPALAALRRTYGLSPLPNGDHQFHITVAARRTKVLQEGDVRKAAADKLPGGLADGMSDSQFSQSALSEGVKHEHEHTPDDQVAKKIAKDHLHEDPAYYKKVEVIERTPEIVKKATKSANSVYLNQALNAFNTRQPIRYDHNKPVFENIQNQMLEMKRRGDFIMQSRRNHETYMSALSPQYRHQRMLQAFRGQLPAANLLDTAMEQYGDQMLGAVGGQR
jgi:hypothetical protein